MMIDDDEFDESQIAIHERNIRVGRKAKTAYDSFMREYFEQKATSLFNNFANVDILADNAKEALAEVHRHCSILKQIEEDLLSVINSGKMSENELAMRANELDNDD